MAVSRKMMCCASWRDRARLDDDLPKVLPFAGMRQAIAEAMTDSLHSMAQLTLTSHADVTSLVGLRDATAPALGVRASPTPT